MSKDSAPECQAEQSFLDGRVTLHAGDCRDVLKTLAENSIDSVVTDPPYFLTSISKRFGAQNAAPAQYGKDGSFSRLSGGFMSKQWDDPGAATGITVWEAWLAGFIAGEGCFRIQSHKDGKYFACSFSIHLRQDDTAILEGCRERIGGRISFCEERTSKQGITSAPDVRWIVETIEGCLSLAAILDKVPLFAKKAADYALWRRALHLWHTTPKGSRWHGPRDVIEMRFLHDQLQKVKRWDNGIDLTFDPFMKPDQFFHYQWARETFRVLKPGGHMAVFGGTRTAHRLICAIEDAGFEIRDMLIFAFGSGFPKNHSMRDIGRPELGTALKPAFEPICLARKPLSETSIAANVLRWGTGAINIGACKIPCEDNLARPFGSGGIGADQLNAIPRGTITGHNVNSRWPANLIHDGSEEVLACFPETSASSDARRRHNGEFKSVAKGRDFPHMTSGHSDSGSSARFFASFSQNDEPSERRIFYTSKAGADDRLGSKHPTVKPLDLIQYLTRLITPPGGIVLDLFAGTGTTGEAAFREGFRIVLIEREPEYIKDIERRMGLVMAGPDERAHSSIKARGRPVDDGPLFAGESAE